MFSIDEQWRRGTERKTSSRGQILQNPLYTFLENEKKAKDWKRNKGYVMYSSSPNTRAAILCLTMNRKWKSFIHQQHEGIKTENSSYGWTTKKKRFIGWKVAVRVQKAALSERKFYPLIFDNSHFSHFPLILEIKSIHAAIEQRKGQNNLNISSVIVTTGSKLVAKKQKLESLKIIIKLSMSCLFDYLFFLSSLVM